MPEHVRRCAGGRYRRIGAGQYCETVEGSGPRFPINLRYPKVARQSAGQHGDADPHASRPADHLWHRPPQVSLTEGPPMLSQQERALSGWVYVDVRGRDLASTVREWQANAVAEQVPTRCCMDRLPTPVSFRIPRARQCTAGLGGTGDLV